MSVDISQVVSLLQNSKNTLFVVGNVLPQEYQIFFEYLYGLRQESQKQSSIFINPEINEVKDFFKGKKFSVLEDIQESRFVVTIPTNGGALSSVSYDTTPDAFKLFISPGSVKLQTSQISFNSIGEEYDLCLSFGLPSHLIQEKLQKISTNKDNKIDLVLFGTKETEEISSFKVFHIGIEATHFVKMILGVSRNLKTTKATRSLFVKFSQLMANYLITDVNLIADLYKTASEFLRQGIEGDKSLNVTLPIINDEKSVPATTTTEDMRSFDVSEYDSIEDSREELAESNIVSSGDISITKEVEKGEIPLIIAPVIEENPKTITRDITHPLNFTEIAKRIKSTRSL